MAKTRLNKVSIYLSDAEKDVIQEAALRVGRSMSNFVVRSGMHRARDVGIQSYGRKSQGQRAHRKDR